MNKVAIAGIGNTSRGDDGIGWHVIDQLKDKISGEIALHKMSPDTADLLSLFESYDCIYLIDAAVYEKDAPFIRLNALEETLPLDEKIASSHGVGLASTVELARALEALPKTLMIYAVKGDDFTIGAAISAQGVQRASLAAKALLQEKEIVSCMKKK
jgi:hydrogenase maturation protease